MNPNVYACFIACLIFPACTGYSEFHSSSYSSSSSSGQSTHSTKIAKENGREVRYCAYKTLKFLPGSNFTDYEDCVRCDCTEKWLTCFKLEANSHSYKHSSGSKIKSQSECTRIQIGCATKWVLQADHSTDCPKEEIPNTIPDFQSSWFEDDDFFDDDFTPVPYF